MKVYSEYEVISVNDATGTVHIRWAVKNHPEQNIIRTHVLPLDAEIELWDEEQIISFWRREVPAVAIVPQWIRDNMEKTLGKDNA